MDKLKKFTALPLCWHIGLFIAFAILNQKGAGMSLIMVDLLLGIIVTPVFLSVLSVVHAIVHEGKVYDYIYVCLMVLLVTGILRGVLYFAFNGGMPGLTLAAGALGVSVGVFTIWACIFALTDRVMKKKPKRK